MAEKTAPDIENDELADAEGASSGEYLRRPKAVEEPFRVHSTHRRMLNKGRGRVAVEEAAAPAVPLDDAEMEDEQTLRSAMLPPRVRVSLRMRRVAAGPTSEAVTALRADDRVALRLEGGRLFELPTDKQAVAGRSPECEVPIADRLCSRWHAAFSRKQGGEVTVRDLGTTNGTYVNGVRITAPKRLSAHDWITLGNHTLELVVSPPEPRLQVPTIPAGPKRKPAASPGLARLTQFKTEPAGPLKSLVSYATTVADRTPAALQADAIREPLDQLLERVELSLSLDEAEAEVASLVALHMAKATRDATWLDYVFRLYSALRLPLPEDLVDHLRDALLGVRQPDVPSFRAYLESLREPQSGAWNETQIRLIVRLAELRSKFEKRD